MAGNIYIHLHVLILSYHKFSNLQIAVVVFSQQSKNRHHLWPYSFMITPLYPLPISLQDPSLMLTDRNIWLGKSLRNINIVDEYMTHVYGNWLKRWPNLISFLQNLQFKSPSFKDICNEFIKKMDSCSDVKYHCRMFLKICSEFSGSRIAIIGKDIQRDLRSEGVIINI